MRNILYVLNRYRNYDYLIYKSLIEKYSLKVIWLFNPPENVPIPEEFINSSRFNYTILGFDRSKGQLKPWHMINSIKLLYTINKNISFCDLIISSTSDSWKSKISYLAAKMNNKPIAFRKEGWLISDKNIKGKLFDRLTKYIEKRSIALLPTSIKSKEKLISYSIPKSKIYLFHFLVEDLSTKEIKTSYINSITEKHNLRDDKINFLYLGRIIPKKGLLELLKVFRELEANYSNIRLLIAGSPGLDPKDKNKYNAYYNKCRMYENSNIVFLGPISFQNIHNVYHLANVFVHPHVGELNGEKIIEGWGNTLSEAASMSLPIISTDAVASAYELIENNRNGFRVNSQPHYLNTELYNSLKYFIDKKHRIKEYGTKSKELYNIVLTLKNQALFLQFKNIYFWLRTNDRW